MKTTRSLTRSALGILLSGMFAAAAVAGPSSQLWSRPSARLVPKAEAAKKVEAPASNLCDSCKTMPITEAGTRGPAGKGTPKARVVGSEHSCTRCAGSVATQKGKVKDGMTHDAGCGPLACCK